MPADLFGLEHPKSKRTNVRPEAAALVRTAMVHPACLTVSPADTIGVLRETIGSRHET